MPQSPGEPPPVSCGLLCLPPALLERVWPAEKVGMGISVCQHLRRELQALRLKAPMQVGERNTSEEEVIVEGVTTVDMLPQEDQFSSSSPEGAKPRRDLEWLQSVMEGRPPRSLHSSDLHDECASKSSSQLHQTPMSLPMSDKSGDFVGQSDSLPKTGSACGQLPVNLSLIHI
eukprot:3146301-Rhodomonas_salina.1